MIGIIGYYISKIYEEVKGRPKYLISKKAGKRKQEAILSGSIKKIIKKIPFVGSYVKKVQTEKKEEEQKQKLEKKYYEKIKRRKNLCNS